MKFRNPKTEENYNLNEKETCTSSGFCREIDCSECPIYPRVSQSNRTCKDWVLIHPYEAARLMGYEMVGDHTEEKEASMGKPRICEVLGVEPYEKFAIGDFTYWIDQDGDMWVEKEIVGQMKCGGVLCTAINHPERIIRKPRFTKQDIEDALTILRVFCRQGIVRRQSRATTPPHSNLTFDYAYINEDMFPSIKEGQEYSLDEIIRCDMLKGND